jgi:Family of unknown function (DUF6401)
MHYAGGFVAAATKGGWLPVLRDEQLDWESLRLAAVCQLVTQVLHPAPSQNLSRDRRVGAAWPVTPRGWLWPESWPAPWRRAPSCAAGSPSA